VGEEGGQGEKAIIKTATTVKMTEGKTTEGIFELIPIHMDTLLILFSNKTFSVYEYKWGKS
jgi:hypothetical protein